MCKLFRNTHRRLRLVFGRPARAVSQTGDSPDLIGPRHRIRAAQFLVHSGQSGTEGMHEAVPATAELEVPFPSMSDRPLSEYALLKATFYSSRKLAAVSTRRHSRIRTG